MFLNWFYHILLRILCANSVSIPIFEVFYHRAGVDDNYENKFFYMPNMGTSDVFTALGKLFLHYEFSIKLSIMI